MKYDREFDFVQKILANFSLKIRFVNDASYNLKNHPVSSYLYDSLKKILDYDSISALLSKEFKPNTIYQIQDAFSCNYIIFLLPDDVNPSYVYIGPYTTEMLTKEKIYSIADKMQFHKKALARLEQFYLSAPLIINENALLSLLYTLGEVIWEGLDNFSLQVIKNPFFPNLKSLSKNDYQSRKESFLELEITEERYHTELQLMQAISKGQSHKAELYLARLLHHQYDCRITSNLRKAKDFVLALNTLFRMSVLGSSVHPYNVNQLCLKYISDIEQLQQPTDIISLIQEMVRQYCLLVKNHSLKNYSPIIQKVITLIDYDLTADLSLNAVAEMIQINPSYLSALFKKELKETLTEHVNRKRMERAAFLLGATNLQIQEIAKQCGISDVNYFTKKFKKSMGKTPKEYRYDIVGKTQKL